MKTINNNGFTIVEIIVVIALIATITAIATPQINDTFSRYQFTNSVRNLLGTMARAKGEAVNTSFPCSIVFSTGADGRVNYTAFVDNGQGAGGISGNGILDGAETIIRADRMPQGVSINIANTTLPTITVAGVNNPLAQFNSLGFAIGFQAGASVLYAGNIQLDTTIRGQLLTRTIQLNIGGNLSIFP